MQKIDGLPNVGDLIQCEYTIHGTPQIYVGVYLGLERDTGKHWRGWRFIHANGFKTLAPPDRCYLISEYKDAE